MMTLLLILLLLLLLLLILRVWHVRLTERRLLDTGRWRKSVRRMRRVTWRLLLLRLIRGVLLLLVVMLLLHVMVGHCGHLLLMPHALLLQRSTVRGCRNM